MGEIISSEEIVAEDPEKSSVETISAPMVNYRNFINYIYWIVTAVFLVRFAKNILLLLFLIKRERSGRIGKLTTVLLKERGNPYSFFNYLFIHPQDLKEDKYLDLVLIHEKAHSRQLHSADILFLEFLGCFFWYNPFLWLYKKEILENHEYLADEAVIKAGGNREVYASQLVKSGGKVLQPLLSGFSFIQTKNRLNMLHIKRSSRSRIALKAGITLFLFAAVFAVSSFNTIGNPAPFVVVVDAGHGGKDSGNNEVESLEKEINLAVAIKLLALGNEKEVRVILLRERDEFLSLEERVNFVNAQGADMFLSLHCNASGDNQKSGAEVIFSPQSNSASQSAKYSRLLANHLLQTVETAEIKKSNFFVLKNSDIPAVMIEMGFMTNTRDFALLRDNRYHQELAEGIYNGLLSIKNEINE
ncbi:M56/M15 family metallopeptidase [Gillisia limnaea]|uniref:M56/M15 family metallopeptidase n=1 Tax=Gillisia limnaea TaxID=195907 RepID=UPI00145D2ED4|nr:M56/M15 family metallopeptidase [Gillisia limnaea]